MTALTDGSALSFTCNGDGVRQSKTVHRTVTRLLTTPASCICATIGAHQAEPVRRCRIRGTASYR